ncbi:MAG: galactokinase [Nocardioides sp.]|uniref:galactokinase n=1 Tax=Nocardioides sp. TaxID=35761 RepID=UPI003F0F6EED
MSEAVTWWAPGRVNLIGEHTDYNHGYVLPLAIGYGCTATARHAVGGRWTARSAQVDEPVTVAPGSLDGDDVPQWARYVLGAATLLRQRGLLPDGTEPGLEVEIDSDVPLGAGLSSSAAVVCACVRALDDLHSLGLDDADLLALSRAVENDVVGAPTGGMDQLASLRGVAGHVLLCDMRSLEAEPIPFDPAAAGLTLLVVDTRTPHAHVDGEYAARRAGCAAAAAALGVDTLREVPDVEALAALPEDLLRLARHVVTENERVLCTAEALRAGELASIGLLLTASHASMRDDFAITVPTVDVCVETLLGAGALGARMTGGGFGGCVIALVPADAVGAAVAAVEAAYAERGWQAPVAFEVAATRGAHRLG